MSGIVTVLQAVIEKRSQACKFFYANGIYANGRLVD